MSSSNGAPNSDGPDAGPEDLEGGVLQALIEGYRERSGVKERMRSLSEYEIARRAGITIGSYVEYADSELRQTVRAVLSSLEARGLVRGASVSGRFETFEPSGFATLAEWSSTSERTAGQSPASVDPEGVTQPTTESDTVSRLDEIIRLLHSIDQRLAARD